MRRFVETYVMKTDAPVSHFGLLFNTVFTVCNVKDTHEFKQKSQIVIFYFALGKPAEKCRIENCVHLILLMSPHAAISPQNKL